MGYKFSLHPTQIKNKFVLFFLKYSNNFKFFMILFKYSIGGGNKQINFINLVGAAAGASFNFTN